MTKRKSRPKRRAESSRHDAQAVASVDNVALQPHSVWSPRTFSMLLGAICSVALLLRLINVLQTVDMPTVVVLLGDAKSYFDWATRIASGQWYGTETFYQAPLYPYTLALLIKVFGSDVLGMRLMQAVFGAASVALLGIAAKNIFRPAVGLVAALMYAVYAPAIYYDGIIQKTSLASFLLCGLLAACAILGRRTQLPVGERKGADKIREEDDLQSREDLGTGDDRGGGYGLSVLIGAILGLLVLTRENSLLWVPLLPLWMWFGFAESRKKRLILAACYFAGLAMVLIPVAARNASLGGEWSPTTFQAGPNFYIGNNLESNGLYRPLIPGHETPFYERADAQRLAEQAEGRALSSREVSRYWAQRSFDEIGKDPGHWLQLMVAKCFMVINRYEVPDVESMYVYRDYSWPLRLLGPWWHFGILCPLAIWGIVVTRGDRSRLWFYYLLILVMIAAVVLFFLLGRYRQPLVPLLILFAAVGALDVYRVFGDRKWKSIRAPLLAALLFVVICNIKVHDESTLRASSYMNLGIAAGQAGDMRTSIKALAHAVQSHPEMAEAHLNLGRALEMTNRPLDAITCYQNAIQLEPNLSMVDSRLADIYERMGDRDGALYHYQRALQIDPSDERAQQAIERLR